MPATGLVVSLLLVLALAIALAVEAVGAARAHRRSATRTLRDYADFAAFIVANAARQEVELRLLYAFSGVQRWTAGSGTPLPPPSALGQNGAEAARCAPEGVDPPTYVRLDLPTDSLVVEGTSLPDSTLRWLADTLGTLARVDTAEAGFHHIFGDAHGAGLVAWSALRDSSGNAEAVYAKTSCFAVNGRSLLALAVASTPALPPTLIGAAPNDSLFSWRLVDPHGHVVQSSAVTYASDIVGATEPLSALGDAVLFVTIRPDVVGRLVIGGIPASRVPLSLLLLALVLLFAGLTMAQLHRLQMLIRLREQFVANVSHELRTPLQQILMFSELLRMEKIDSDAERGLFLEIMERESRRLIHLVDNVLRLSRGARNDDPLSSGPVEVGRVIQDTVRAFEPLARARNARVGIQADPGLKAAADMDALRRILLNLLDNAVKYGPPDQEITISAERSGDRILVRVDDQGPGVPHADRERVFLPFHRLAREESAAISGSGVGLAIVRDLATRMGGGVTIEDAPRGGCRFTVTLPGPASP
jgi:signal transduction histidine kinase